MNQSINQNRALAKGCGSVQTDTGGGVGGVGGGFRDVAFAVPPRSPKRRQVVALCDLSSVYTLSHSLTLTHSLTHSLTLTHSLSHTHEERVSHESHTPRRTKMSLARLKSFLTHKLQMQPKRVRNNTFLSGRSWQERDGRADTTRNPGAPPYVYKIRDERKNHTDTDRGSGPMKNKINDERVFAYVSPQMVEIGGCSCVTKGLSTHAILNYNRRPRQNEDYCVEISKTHSRTQTCTQTHARVQARKTWCVCAV